MGVFRTRLAGFIPAAAASFSLVCAVSSSAGEKIVIETTKKIEIPKARELENTGKNRSVFDTGEIESGLSSASPQNPNQGSNVDRDLQKLIDRKKNWLFYGPESDKSISQNFLKTPREDSSNRDEPFRPASERFMSGEDPNKSDSDSTATSDSRETRSTRDARDSRPEEEGETFNQEFNISGFLRPESAQSSQEDNRGNKLTPTFFEKPNQYNSIQQSLGLNNRTSTQRKEADRAYDRERSAQFQTLLNGGASSASATGDPRLQDPLGRNFGMDSTRQAVNPYAPTSGPRPSITDSPTAQIPSAGARGIDIPRPDALPSGGAISRPAMLGETRIIAPPSAPSARSISPFAFEAPKRKF